MLPNNAWIYNLPSAYFVGVYCAGDPSQVIPHNGSYRSSKHIGPKRQLREIYRPLCQYNPHRISLKYAEKTTFNLSRGVCSTSSQEGEKDELYLKVWEMLCIFLFPFTAFRSTPADIREVARHVWLSEGVLLGVQPAAHGLRKRKSPAGEAITAALPLRSNKEGVCVSRTIQSQRVHLAYPVTAKYSRNLYCFKENISGNIAGESKRALLCFWDST